MKYNRFLHILSRTAIMAVMVIAAVSVAAPLSASAQEKANTYFQYPQVPENLENFTDRSNFFIENFWKRCNFKSAFSSRQRMEEAFRDYIDLMPYADAEVVHKSIENLIAEVQKNPKNLLTLAEIAENNLYSDTAIIVCDECYLPFAKAVADNRKIAKAEKARFEYQASALAGSQVGMPAPDFTYTTPTGEKGKLSDLTQNAYVLLFINDPDCDECELARVRLAADANLNELLDSGKLIVMSIYPGEVTEEWIDRTSVYNRKWIVGATPDIDELYDMRNPPVIYYLNPSHEILSKSFQIDNLLEAFRQVNRKMNRK